MLYFLKNSIVHPIFQAPMAGSQNHKLAVAVARAGGLGAIAAAMLTPDGLRAEVQAFRAACPTQALNINFFCHTPPTPHAQAEQAWRTALRPYHMAHGIDPNHIPAHGSARTPFDTAMADVVEELRPEVVSFHFGLPQAALLHRVKACGARVLASATTVAEARWLQAQGADAVIAQGLEAGGHRGHFLDNDVSLQLGTLALLPQVVRAVSVPVVAAGGIATPQAVQAALTLGAHAVQVGTAYLLCPEATTAPLHRAALSSPRAQHTVLTRLLTGRPARGIPNRLMQELGAMSSVAPDFPLAATALAPLRQAAEALGEDDFSPLWAGQSAPLCQTQPAEALTHWLATGKKL
jgi:nitronate monooxygenase